MKKYLIVLLVAVLIAMLPLAAYATTEIAPVEGGDVTGIIDAPVEETATEGEETDEGWFYEAKEWCAVNFSGIITVLAAIYALLPKYGGVAAILKVVRDVSGGLKALKQYMDDKNNPDSIYNVMARQGDAISKFMNDIAPVLEKLEVGLEKIGHAAISQDKLRAVLLAVEEGEELMAKEFSDLLSCSTTISQKHKAEFEEAYLEARQHLKVSVKEALDDDGQKEEAVA